MNFKSSKIRWVMALSFAFVVTLAVAITIMSIHGARADSSPTGASIASDMADYQPGATVTLTGAGWASGEDVQIYVNDSVGNTWSLTSGQNGAPSDPVAESDGSFKYSFSLPNWFVANYSATATGSTSGTATTTFTDSPASNCPSSPTASNVDQNPDNNVSATFTTSGNTATYTLSSVNLSPSGGVPGLIEYCVYTTPQPDATSVKAIYPNWVGLQGTSAPFTFIRTNGTSNIPFDGNTYKVGQATWTGGVPSQSSQTYVLHVADSTFCGAYNGQPTCFVLPGTIPTAKDLTVTKTAIPSFTRTYKWTITKSVDQKEIDIADGKSATFNYTVNVNETGFTDSDWQVTGNIIVSNPNGFDVSGVNVTDAIDNNGSCTVNGGTNVTVPANNSVQVSYTCTYTSAPSPGSGTNTATASWTNYGSPKTSATGTHDYAFGAPTKLVNQTITVTDAFNGGTPTTLGTLTATDSTPFASKSFSESQTVSGVAGTCTTYNNTATIVETKQTDSASVKVCVGADLTVSKTATPSFIRTYTWGISKSVDQNQINTSGSATFNYTVSVTHDSGTDSGWQVTGQITVTNPNDWEAITADVTDAIDNGGKCSVTGGSNVPIDAGKSVTLDYSCTYDNAPSPLKGTNTATATWDATAASTPDGSASGSKDFDFSQATPNVVDGSVSVTDTFKGNLGTVNYIDPSPTTFTYSRTESGTPGTCTSYDNTATFTTDTTKTTGSDSKTVKVCVGVDLTVSKTATPSFTRTFKWGITKDVDKTEIDIAKGNSATFNYTLNVTHDSGTDSNWLVTGKITVTNPNDWEAITTDVSDAINDGGSCTVSGGTGVSVPASGSQTLDYTCIYTSAPSPSSGTTSTNTATASWDKAAASTPTGTASGTADVDFSKATPTTVVDGSITVIDDQAGLGNPVNLGTVSYTDPSPTTIKYTLTFPGKDGTCTNYTNTATFTTDTGITGSDSKTVKVCVGIDLTVSKTASASFTRTYAWSIAKSVDKTLVEQIGGTATFNYTVNVKETGFTDSGWQVNGTITVNNPNDWEAITADVSDAIDNNGTCTVTGGNNVSVPANGTVNLPYICTYSSAPTPLSGTNTATATWDKIAASTQDDSASGTAGYAFTIPTTVVNQDITVTDTFNGVATTLGTLIATDAQPFASATFTYHRTVNVPTSNCVKYTNTATIVETGQQSDSKTVEVCGPAKTGALTMGFWQNKNGQGIITGGSSTAGVCNSGTWLRQYAPFQDLSATSSCSQVASYVLNIIKGANASGSSMNAMLKAQMLATALDVYFSDSALGGNKINAPTPIGGVKIDLMKICAMIDGSSGTGTCSGNYENVSSAFGGATSLTVSQMLAYAASQSNAGGITWYGNVKATQQLAKDAFDAINNQVAFAP